MTLQVAHLVQGFNRTFDERRLSGADFLDVDQPSIPYGTKASFTS
jgi:hypothetical protein